MNIRLNKFLIFLIALLAVIAITEVFIEGFQSAVEVTTPVFTQFIAAKHIIPQVFAQRREPRYRNEIDQYIYEKFGKDGDLAVRIARAESGTGVCDRLNFNKNGSIDVGRFMINSIHFKRFPLKDLVDCKKNVDAAFQIYSEQHGFQAWVVYSTGAYKKVDLTKYLNYENHEMLEMR